MIAITVCAPSCLVTSSPDFDDPVQTPPVLVASEARPDPREIQVVESTQGLVTFEAPVRSEEDLGQNIQVRLFIDYGTTNGNGLPYLTSLDRQLEVLPAATPDEPRRAVATWNPAVAAGVTHGCHTFTLIVSHAFDSLTGCPEVLTDSSELTWHVFYCEAGQPCPPEIDDPRTQCPVPTTRCPDVADEASENAGGGEP